MTKLYCDGSGMIIGFLGKEIGLCDLKSCDDCKKEDEKEKRMLMTQKTLKGVCEIEVLLLSKRM